MDSDSAGVAIQTYHCVCTTLILATPYNLETLPKRAAPVQDRSAILPLRAESTAGAPISSLHNVSEDRKPIVIRRDDGFEKRDLLRCTRCHLPVGYKLVDTDANPDVCYILPDGLVTTEKMKESSGMAEAS